MTDLLTRLADRSVVQATERSAEIGDCLVWTGVVTKGGYGKTSIKKRTVTVHRAAWIERHGPIPPETPHVLHRCDNPPCWRDEHLFLGTAADNAADRARKRRGHQESRTHCVHGHEFTPENTYRRKDRPGRICRACRRAALSRLRRRRGVPERGHLAGPS